LRRFVDLHLRPPPQDVKAIERMAHLAAEIGFHLAGLAFDSQVSKESRQRTAKLFEDRGLETVSRIDLRPKDRNELLTSLRKVRSSFDIVAVECHMKQVASLAFRDRRVDLVFFSPNRPKSRFNELMPRRSRRPVEFNIADLLRDDLTAEPGLRRASNLVSDAQRKHLPIVISSGATDWLSMRAPRDMAAILSVLGLEAVQALDAVSHIPLSIAQENLEKRGPRFISNGMEIVRPRA